MKYVVIFKVHGEVVGERDDFETREAAQKVADEWTRRFYHFAWVETRNEG